MAEQPPTTKRAAQTAIQKARVADALAAEVDAAKEAGALAFYARLMAQITMPHSDPKTNEFERRNGNLVMAMWSRVGLPYGVYPRLLLSWITTQAVREKSPEIALGHSMREFMRRLDLGISGGAKGTSTVLQRQMKRLFSSAITCTYEDEGFTLRNVQVISQARLWWDPMRPEQVNLFASKVVLTQDFFQEVVTRPVPINLVHLKALAKTGSPLAIDIYTWLVHRMFYLKKDVALPWDMLALQFGANYGTSWHFKSKFLKQLKVVKQLYPDARVGPTNKGDALLLEPSPPLVQGAEMGGR